jgi:ATP-dependent helicase/DNAse subunit B
MDRILKLEEEPEMEENISSMEKGSLVHRILFRYYSSLNKESILPDSEKPLEILTRIAREEFDKLPYSGVIWTLEKEIYFGRPGVKGLWERILEVDAEETAETGFSPRYLEFAFGKAGSRNLQDPQSSGRPLLINRGGHQIKLIGKIDRIDVNRKNHGVVLDYKIGRTVTGAKTEDLLNGKSLQLPVYLYAVRNRIDKIRPVAAGYYQVKDAENCQRLLVLTDVQQEPGLEKKSKPKSRLPLRLGETEITLENLVEKSLDFVAAYVEDIKRGKFSHTTQPQDERCQSYCPFNQVCRKDVGKLKYLSAQNKN